jgi:aminocarboxymuconate-semialdehyde decarboxylase
MVTVIDFHTHWIPSGLPDLAARTGDRRWPVFDPSTGTLAISGETVRALPPSGWDVHARLDAMDAAGHDRHVLSPVPPLLCDWAGLERGTEWAIAINDGLAEVAAANPDRFSALGTIPVAHPDQSIKVMERAKASGLAGIEVATTAMDLEFDAPGPRQLFTAAAELGLIVFVHPLILGPTPRWTDRISSMPVNFGLGMTTDTAITAARLLFGGVLKEAAGLRICLAHGGGTFTWALARLALRWNDEEQGMPLARALESVYVDSVVYQAPNLRYLVDTLGADHVVFGTDFPLPVHADPAGAIIDGLDDAAAAQVRGGTASALLGLSPDSKNQRHLSERLLGSRPPQSFRSVG